MGKRFEAWKQAASEAGQQKEEEHIMTEDVQGQPQGPPPPKMKEEGGLEMLRQAVERKVDGKMLGTLPQLSLQC